MENNKNSVSNESVDREQIISAMSFEEAMKRLEEISNKLENGQATLDESLALYEEGIALVRHCNEKLNYAEQKIRMLDPNSIPFES